MRKNIPIVILVLSFLFASCGNKKADSGENTFTGEVTFARDIAPIMYANCSPCHHSDAGAPFNLVTYDDVRKKAKTIVKVTQSGFMPPWPADTKYVSFAGEKKLSDTEKAMLKAWSDAGCPPGDTAHLRVPEFTAGSLLGKPDTVIYFPDILIDGTNSDHFFLVKVPFTLPEKKYVKTIEFVPGNKKYAHHMNANLIAYQNDAKKDVYQGKKIIPTNLASDGMTIQKEMDNLNDDGSFPEFIPNVCNYLPGVSPSIYPEGIGGYRLPEKGTFFINDYHFGPNPVDTIDSGSHFNIFYAEEAPRRPTHDILLGSLSIHAQVKPKLVIPANTEKTFYIDWTVPQKISLLTVNPHMHLLGKTFLAYAITPDYDTIPLIRIPKWDFRWQYFYTYKHPVILPEGSVIHVEGSYDNTEKNPNNPFFPPQVVIDRNDSFDSMRTTNEMLQFIITVVPYQAGDENIDLEQGMLR